MVGYPKREKGTRRNHCNFWGKGGRKCADWRGNGAGGIPQSFRQTTSGAHGRAARADCLPRGKPPASNSMCRLGRKEAHRRGLTRRLRRGVGLAVSWGSRQLWCPKVSKGERREAGIQWIQPPKAVSDSEFRQTTSGAHGSANRADCLPRGKPFGAPTGAGLLPMGTDAPTTARMEGLPPRRG